MFIANLNLGAGKLPQKSVKQCNLELIHKSLDYQLHHLFQNQDDHSCTYCEIRHCTEEKE